MPVVVSQHKPRRRVFKQYPLFASHNGTNNMFRLVMTVFASKQKHHDDDTSISHFNHAVRRNVNTIRFREINMLTHNLLIFV